MMIKDNDSFESPESSAIRGATYVYSSTVLTIFWKDGYAYRYASVPAATFQAFKQASSKGRFYHASIDKRFKYERI